MSSDAAGCEHRTRLDDNTKATDTLITHETRRRDTSTPEDIIVQDVMNSLATLSKSETPTNMWLEPGEQSFWRLGPDQRIWSPWTQATPDHFVAALRNGTTTGVLKHRLMRLNSTVRCEEFAASASPATCSGKSPFIASFVQRGGLNARLCVPGQRQYPW